VQCARLRMTTPKKKSRTRTRTIAGRRLVEVRAQRNRCSIGQGSFLAIAPKIVLVRVRELVFVRFFGGWSNGQIKVSRVLNWGGIHALTHTGALLTGRAKAGRFANWKRQSGTPYLLERQSWTPSRCQRLCTDNQQLTTDNYSNRQLLQPPTTTPISDSPPETVATVRF
jgi:hypothetical protein